MKEIAEITREYNSYLRAIAQLLDEKNESTTILSRMIDDSPAIHIFGFGRSGTAALAMAIRLRHFLSPAKEVSWLGDQVRTPIREKDLVILFSGSGNRKEVLAFLGQACEKKARTFAITLARKSPLALGATENIILPGMDSSIVYGGGDFELAAWYFQEVFLTRYGLMYDIPKERIGQNHV